VNLGRGNVAVVSVALLLLLLCFGAGCDAAGDANPSGVTEGYRAAPSSRDRDLVNDQTDPASGHARSGFRPLRHGRIEAK